MHFRCSALDANGSNKNIRKVRKTADLSDSLLQNPVFLAIITFGQILSIQETSIENKKFQKE